MRASEMRCVSVEIDVEYDDETDEIVEPEGIGALTDFLDGLGDRVKHTFYTCEGTPEQVAENPNCDLYVAALTTEEYEQFRSLIAVVDGAGYEDIRADQRDTDPDWNGAIYYCGSACDLPGFPIDPPRFSFYASDHTPTDGRMSEQVELADDDAAREHAAALARNWAADVKIYYLLPDGTHAGRDADDVLYLDDVREETADERS